MSETSSQDEPQSAPVEPRNDSAMLAQLRGELAQLQAAYDATPKRIRALEERLYDSKDQLQGTAAQNARLADTLRAAKQQLEELREEVERLSSPPQSVGSFLRPLDDKTVYVLVGARKMRVTVGPAVAISDMRPGQEVLLNEAMNVVQLGQFEDRGELATVIDLMEDGRCVVTGHTDDERVVHLSDRLLDGPLKAGDSVLVDMRANIALERVSKPETERLVLEEVPDVTYEMIGGLGDQVESIRDAVELPYLYADLFVEHELRAPKGILLYGPPGCGKTMIAKAVANSLAKRVEEKTGRSDVRSYFLNIKGPELLNKYVGETERQIRLIFQRAREKAAEGFPVIVFFDEMESLFRIRGSGISSDMESTIVPQLLAEIDGVEQLKDVVIIGASNREDMIDPAILRPGRLDVKIKVDRPGPDAAREIFRIYMHANLPLHEEELARHGNPHEAVDAMIDQTVEKMYATDKDNEFLEVTYADGEKELLYFKDFNSGAMIESVVSRAKKYAIKRYIEVKEKGLKTTDLISAIKDEFRENEDLPNTTNPDDWARISGKKGERIVYVRSVISHDSEKPGRTIENLTPGQYL